MPRSFKYRKPVDSKSEASLVFSGWNTKSTMRPLRQFSMLVLNTIKPRRPAGDSAVITVYFRSGQAM